MNWQEVCEHPDLQDLPFKVELNERGQVILSPTKVTHSLQQAEINYQLRVSQKTGKTLTECAISTTKGTTVADVAWVSAERLPLIKGEVECPIAPEICVEIISAGNTNAEIEEKKALYFAQGAEEVWICSEQGDMTFFAQNGKLSNSQLVPNFVKQIDID